MPSKSKEVESFDIEIRPLTEKEIKRLEKELGKPIDRQYLTHWIQRATDDVVKFGRMPNIQGCRDEYLRIAEEGHRWLSHIENCQEKSLLYHNTDLHQLIPMVTGFCASTQALAEHLSKTIKPGGRTPPALEAFLCTMIGVAKRARVLPSTPGRGEKSVTAPRPNPAFFKFTLAALAIARDMIESSRIPTDLKKAALSSLRPHSNDALVKVIVRLRGQISDYYETDHGLVESAFMSKPPYGDEI
jgi:hypothetical protein